MIKKKIAILLGCLLVLQLLSPILGLSYAVDTSRIDVNFQPEEASISEDSFPDYGQLYGNHNGWNYGWNHDISSKTVAQATYGTEDIQTYVRFEKEDVWEFELESGFYDVTVTVGDAVYSSMNTVWIEDTVFFDKQELAVGQTAEVTKNVLVADGALTLHQGVTGDEQTALQQLQIVKTAEWLPPDPDVIVSPTITAPPEARTAVGNKVLISGKMNNPHNAPPFLAIDGLQEEISAYLNGQKQEVEDAITDYVHAADVCSGCDESAIQQAILDHPASAVKVIQTGHLNLDDDVQFGNMDHPAVVIVEGLNTNQPLTVEVYGTLIIRQNLNANQGLSIVVHKTSSEEYGNLWVQGNLHLNNDSEAEIAGQLYANNLTYNNGELNVHANHILVASQMHINTQVDMFAQKEMMVKKLVSNNDEALLKVGDGDLFVQDNININNNLAIETGGWFVVGGDMTANKRPLITTGTEGGTGTLLKFKLYGLLAEYFSEPSFTGDRLLKIDSQIDFNQTPQLIDTNLTSGGYSVRWTGQIQPRYTETYEFQTDSKGGVRLWVDGQLLIDAWNDQNQQAQGTISLLAGRRYDIKMEYYTSGSTKAELYWKSPSQSKEIVPKHRLHPFAVPSELSDDATETKIMLSWEPVANAGAYDVEVDGHVQQIGDQPVFIHDDLSPGTSHQYRVRAIQDDMVGEWSPLVTSWTLPDVPEGIVLSSTMESIRLEWQPVIGATGYEVEVDSAIVHNGTSLVFELTDLNPNMQKAFRVRAKNSSGAGKWSEVLVESTGVGVPQNLTGSADDRSVTLSWHAVSGADAYDLEIDGEIVEDLTERSYLHDGVESNSVHQYRVRAKNEKGAGLWSDPITVYTLPSIPAHIEAATSNNEIVLTWDAVLGAVSYDIEIDGEVVEIGISTTYQHTGLAENEEHVYRVRAQNEHVASHWSEPVRAITLAGVPSNVQAEATSTSIMVTWNSVLGAEIYDIEVDGIVMDNGLQTHFEHLDLQPLSDHTYRVRARSQAGTGEWSDMVRQRTSIGIPNVRISQVAPDSIELTWDLVPGALSYDLMIDGSIVENHVGNTFLHASLDPNSYHFYRVRARSGSATGDWSESITQTTRLGTPHITNIIAESHSIWLKWEKVDGAESYELEVDGQVIDVGAAQYYLHDNLSSNSTHSYRVRAKNSSGYSAWSDWSTNVTKSTPPNVPRHITFDATTDSITISWDEVVGASSYEVEVDGVIRSGLNKTSYTVNHLDSNTMHVFRVRAMGTGGRSSWTELYQEKTVPEIIVHVGKDTSFNFVIVAPAQSGKSRRTITVTYNPDDVEVLDLYGLTPEPELQTGSIEGTRFTIVRFEAGTIVYMVEEADKTIFNMIKFRAKNNEHTNITYTIE